MYLRSASLIFLSVATLHAQTFPRRADIRGGDDQGRGKCTVEVVVDGAVEIEIRGDSGVMRNLSGQPPQWRRFICNAPMPQNPAGFRFAGVDGRGRQTLVRPPVNNAPAVIRIEDPDNGSEGYTFDIFWEGRGGGGNYSDRRPDRGPDPRRRFSPADAIRACQDSIRDQARDRFRGGDIQFRRVAMDDDPGHRDRVVGSFEVRRDQNRDRPDVIRFSCSVDFDGGRIRSADIEPPNVRGGDFGRGDLRRDGGSPVARATQNCQRSVEERLGRDGFGRVEFLSINVDDQPGRRDWIVGNARASARDGSQSFRFSCSVSLETGDVRSVDVRPR